MDIEKNWEDTIFMRTLIVNTVALFKPMLIYQFFELIHFNFSLRPA